ncbi:MAG TPA: hypothetical protein DCY86_01110 [Bdellovibrionales bacterium]|nr:hypothetical protein [Bdellovibrionales bacterium]
MKKYLFPLLLILSSHCLAADFYVGYVQTDLRRFPIFISKGPLSTLEIAGNFSGKNVLLFESPDSGTLIIDRTDPKDPIIYSAILIEGKRLLVGTKSSDLQKLFQERPPMLTYHFNQQSVSMPLEDRPSLY